MQNIADGNTKPLQEVVDALPEKQEASWGEGVERFRAYREFHSDDKGIASLAACECVMSADHDRVVAEKDAVIAELRAELTERKKSARSAALSQTKGGELPG